MNGHSFRAMGTEVVATGRSAATVSGFFAAAERVFSRFDPASELSLLNADPAPEVTVSEELAACLERAAALRSRTGGLVDPAVGGAVVDWGYDRTFSAGLDRRDVRDTPELGSWTIADRQVRREPGTALDLGGIAKGWTADLAVEAGLADMVSAGGDVRSQRPDTTVAIVDPWGHVAARLQLGRGGLATSSSTRRRWKVGDVDAHHIIDPRRLRPADSPVYSATVMAATAVEAEAGAKAVLIHGEQGLAWAEKQDWIDAALVVWHDGNVYATTGWTLAA